MEIKPLTQTPAGKTRYDLWSIRPGETWRFENINARALYNSVKRLRVGCFSVKVISPTMALVTRF